MYTFVVLSTSLIFGPGWYNFVWVLSPKWEYSRRKMVVKSYTKWGDRTLGWPEIQGNTPEHETWFSCWRNGNMQNNDDIIWLVVSTILKNMKVNRKDYPIYCGKKFETTNKMMTLWIMMMSSDSNYTAGFWASGFCGQPHIATVCGSQQSKLHSGQQILSDQQKTTIWVQLELSMEFIGTPNSLESFPY